MKQARAHGNSESDAGIQATMHIDPADHPAAGQEARFFFTFQDPEGLFELDRCDCYVELLKDNTEIDRQLVSLSDSQFASLGSQPLYSKTFEQAGMYQLHLEGTPKNGAVFDPFELSFDVHVAQASHQSVEHHTLVGEHLGHIVIFGAGLLAAIGLLIHNYLQKRKT